MAALRRVRRYALGGALIGLALGLFWARLRYGADGSGVRAIGILEGWLLTSLPGSLLVPALAWLAPRGGLPTATPAWALYALLIVVPALNWAALGALAGRHRDRAEAARASRPAV